MKCYWCGKEAVEMPLIMFDQRVGDTYICMTCGYHWDRYGKGYASNWKSDRESLLNRLKKLFKKSK